MSGRGAFAAALCLAAGCSQTNGAEDTGIAPETFGASSCADADAPTTPIGEPTDRVAVFGDRTYTVTERALPPADPDPYASYAEDEPRLRYGLTDLEGGVVVPAVYAEFGYMAQDGLLWARCGQDYGLIDETGTEIVPAVFGAVRARSESLVAVYASQARGGNGGWGYYGTNGTASLPMRYENALPFAEGRAFVLADGAVSVIGRSGERLAGPVRHASYLSDTFGTYRLEDEAQIGGRAALFAGFAPVTLASTHASTGLLDADGAWVVPPIYDRIETTRIGPYVRATQYQTYIDHAYDAGDALFGLDGTMIVSPTPQRSVNLSYGEYFTEMEHRLDAPPGGPRYRMGLIALDGERVVPTAYDTVRPLRPSEDLNVPEGAYFEALSGDRRRILARGGEPVTPWRTDEEALLRALREVAAEGRD